MMRIQRLGEVGLLVDLADLDEVLRLDAAIADARESDPAFAGVVDVLPAARTLMLATTAGADLGALQRAVESVKVGDASGGEAGQARVVEIPVIYDGPDLEAVAEHAGLSVSEVIAAHTGTPWTSAFGGFAPGFFYLVDGDPRLEVPRRSEPRTAVPDGAVALAGTFSAVYPRTSPGGWQLIGHTPERMWDSDRTPPALLAPGDRVQFIDAGGAA